MDSQNDYKQTTYYVQPQRESNAVVVAKKTSVVFFNILQVIIVIGVILVILYLFVFPINVVSGRSMNPNFCDKDIYITYKLGNYFSSQPYQFGDVISFKVSEGVYYIKRIIGLPGDAISIVNGRVFRNGELLDEVYLPVGRVTDPGGFLSEGQVVTVPKGKYFVLGDNRPHSVDSREFGPIDLHENAINGRVVLVVWPPQRMRFFDNNQVFPKDECK